MRIAEPSALCDSKAYRLYAPLLSTRKNRGVCVCVGERDRKREGERMECNKDEAIRAREIAEMKLAAQDYAGAKKFVQKALQLFPGLENTLQMLAVIDVHLAAHAKLNGTETDWYGILQVDSAADDMAIKRQYKKLALLLHPDKNKSVGAEAAFKLIGEAFQVLCDKTKRILHDMKRGGTIRQAHGVNVSQQQTYSARSQSVRTQNVHAGYPDGQYAGVHSQHVNTSNGQYPRMPHQPPPQPPAFWTACPSCQMRYQYLRTYENQNLLCPNCRLPFVAKDINSMQANMNSMHGTGGGNIFGWSAHSGAQQQQASKTFGPGFSAFNGFMGGTRVDSFQNNSTSGGTFTTSMPGAGTKSTADFMQQMNLDKARRERAEAEREQKRKRKEEEQKEKEIEKELKRKEREQQKKAKADEALDRLMAKKKQQAEKAAARERKRLVKKHRSESSSEDEEEDDVSEDDQGLQETHSLKAYPRRSSRARRNVIYKVDESDDDDIQEFPPSKKARATGEGKESDNSAGKENVLSSKMDNGGASAPFTKGTSAGSEGKEKQAENGSQSLDLKGLLDLAKNRIRIGLNLHNVKPTGPASELKVGDTKEADSTKDEKCIRGEGLEKPMEAKIGIAGTESSGVDVNLEKKASGKDDAASLVPEKSSAQGCTDSLEQVDEASPSKAADEPETFIVPDSDFHDFDADRKENNIDVGQIWALYDDQDGMPRYYIRVKEVQSRNPFKVNVAWLELRNPSEEQEELLESGFSFACGEFRNAQSQVMDNVNIFSHILKWEKGSVKGSVRVYPREGEIWGLYRDWKPGQKLIKADDASLKYDVVQVVTDFGEQIGVVVVFLVKLQGFKTVFVRSEESTLLIPPAEIHRFSHQVPAYKLRGDEAPGVPAGSWELDPASVPMDLIFSSSDAEKAR